MITAQDIRAKTFEKAVFGGYEMGSVDDYLEAIAQELEAQSKEIAILKGKMKILADKVEEYRNTEEAMRQALVSAQQLASQIEEDAKVKGEAIITDATTQSLETLAEIKQQIAAEENKLATVQSVFAKFLTDARGMCERQIRYLDAVPQTGGGVAAPKIDRIPESEQMRITEPAPDADGFEATQLFSL